ncbi:cytochrome c-type biogenesis protein [Agaribacter marinus]|uniref:Cytochrome c-type biogenesis protein n=1 Tax=Agaribacter marinus TaxID=1431249 RepID=A0AA37SXG6_9ALTE|nr:cytochrome c-type biogenesis protein [Agaribacter marinus]GLR70897.1 cystathionine gamma-synthase [Agaribacter marinus]
MKIFQRVALLMLFLSLSHILPAFADDKAERAAPQGYAENYAFDDPEQRQVFIRLTKELRCPMCQNQNIADSDAMIAHDMRRKVYQLMQEGKSESDVVDFMKQRYGDFVYYQPPVNTVTIWLWLIPLLFIIVMSILFVVRRKSADETNIDEKLAKADAMLKDD